MHTCPACRRRWRPHDLVMWKWLAVGLLLAACGGEDGPVYESCVDARLAYAETGCAMVLPPSASELVQTCDGLAELRESGIELRCADGSDFVERLEVVCAGDAAAAVCEECSHDFDCNRCDPAQTCTDPPQSGSQ